MKIKLALLILIFFILCFSCDPSFIQNNNAGNTDGLEIDIISLRLTSRELATVPGRNVPLTLTIFPHFATRNEVTWSSSNPNVATISSEAEAVDSQGNLALNLTVKTDAVTEPESTVIRVSSVFDPSIYAECTLTIYPSYPRNRRLYFNATDGWTANAVPAIYLATADAFGDLDLGNGMYLLLGTGGASEYNTGNAGPGVYEIDPENPYEYGVVPTGTAGAFGTTTWEGGSATFDDVVSVGHIRTNGNRRKIKIAAVFGPFEIQVNYMTNSGGSPRNADIRIGDTEGLRIEGETSSTTSPPDPKIVSYRFESDEFVPVIYIETNQGVRIYDVIIRDLSE